MRYFLFDIDNTLTPPRQKMSVDFTLFFLSWMRNKKVFLVGGSNFLKISEQLPASMIYNSEGIFSSMANELSYDGDLAYKNEWKLPQDLREDLEAHVDTSRYNDKTGVHIEERIGMINFSVAGRNSNHTQRKAYNQWDKQEGEREAIVEFIEINYPEVEAKIGGEISIDIFPKGKDKSQASKWVRNNLKGDIIFIGDQCGPKGNDYAIYKDVIDNGGVAHEVNDYSDTFKILDSNYS